MLESEFNNQYEDKIIHLFPTPRLIHDCHFDAQQDQREVRAVINSSMFIYSVVQLTSH